MKVYGPFGRVSPNVCFDFKIGTFLNASTQHVEWDLNKTSKTITETLLALTLMLYGSQKNVV